MAEHTPGPWKIYGNAKNLFGDDISAVIIGRDGFPVAEAGLTAILPDWHVRTKYKHWSRGKGETFIERPVGEVAADARLISAAPELLEALTRYVEQEERAAPASASPFRSRGRVAIAKATGKR